MSKEMYMASHKDLIQQYLNEHPDAGFIEAYEATADKAWDRMRDMYGDRADYERMKRKEQSNG